jgi:hypothetical protein
MTKKDSVLNHLKVKGQITSWSAIKLFNVTRLAQVVHVPKKEGYKITTKLVPWRDKKEKTHTQFAVYIYQGKLRKTA